MDMIYDELNRVLDSAGVPRIAAIVCPYCGGSGYVPRPSYTNIPRVARCTACAGNGKITVEQT